ncbi:hypothetical protein VCHA54P496_410001 [Vibrio chagasii]|nr:hypothetical protein VCHA49P381_20316 [Vibrio chagasii]CAH7265692.1 hypothetical protein VCHA53O464_10502 [Vibrio chagasii]CAH7295026.1 hypothetical protein VCHA54P496_410001 [Vibrio chagasii]CAH7297198.1 hypothetical protein VCHA54P495_420011 [Vibrio chagasii]
MHTTPVIGIYLTREIITTTNLNPTEKKEISITFEIRKINFSAFFANWYVLFIKKKHLTYQLFLGKN